MRGLVMDLWLQTYVNSSRNVLSLVENRILDVGFLNTYFQAYVHVEFIKYK